MGFISDHMELLLAVIGILIFCIFVARALKKAHRIDRDGIETDAVVVRIEQAWDKDTMSTSYITVVRYEDMDGNTLESSMTIDSSVNYEVGDPVRIKYIPGETEMVRPVR